jgi:DNA end-binding protein Ku
MPKPIWNGAISFGLLNIPVQLMPAEKRIDLHFRMLDHRNNAPVRYERVNAETGEEVPWKDIVKAFEYQKGSYVVVDKDDLKNAAPESAESVNIEAFVDIADITPRYFEKPYFLVPSKKSEKGYVLLRDTLRKLNKVGVARVVIRTREYLALVMPENDALVLILIRYEQELIAVDEYTFPKASTIGRKISAKEMEMAEQLVESMSAKWEPEGFHDEFREKLSRTIEARIKKKGGTVRSKLDKVTEDDSASGKVVDFMALLKKSIDSNKRTPAKAAVKKAATKKTGAKPKRKAS